MDVRPSCSKGPRKRAAALSEKSTVFSNRFSLLMKCLITRAALTPAAFAMSFSDTRENEFRLNSSREHSRMRVRVSGTSAAGDPALPLVPSVAVPVTFSSMTYMLRPAVLQMLSCPMHVSAIRYPMGYACRICGSPGPSESAAAPRDAAPARAADGRHPQSSEGMS